MDREVLEGIPHLVELGGGSVDFEADEIGDFEGLIEEVAHIFKVSQSTLAADVSLAAKNDSVAAGEVVKEDALLAPGSLDEGGQS